MFVLLTVLISVLLIALLRMSKVGILSPPVALTLYWSFFIFAAFIAFPEYPWQYFSSLWILGACAAFSLSYMLVYNYYSKKIGVVTKELKGRSVNIKWARRSLVTCIALAVVYVVLKLSSYGVEFSILFNIDQLLELNNRIAVSRYSGDIGGSIALQALLVFVYAAPLLGGYLLSYFKKRKHKILSIISIIPALLSFIVSNEKAILLVCIVFWVSAFLVGFLARHRRFPRITKKIFIGITLGIVILLSLFVLSMMMRLGAVDQYSLADVSQKIASSYAFGHMPALDSVFTNIIPNQGLALGGYTLYGLSDSLGLMERVQGVYSDYFVYGMTNANIYTAFRGLIVDFGYVGALVLHGLMGAVVAKVVLNLKYHRKSSTGSQWMLVVVYSFILFSFTVSIFSYLSLVFALILFAIFCKLIQSRES